jgi:hypothetical protein
MRLAVTGGQATSSSPRSSNCSIVRPSGTTSTCKAAAFAVPPHQVSLRSRTTDSPGVTVPSRNGPPKRSGPCLHSTRRSLPVNRWAGSRKSAPENNRRQPGNGASKRKVTAEPCPSTAPRRSYPARGPGQAGLRMVSSVKRMSSAVIGVPSDQRAPGRSEKVADDPSGAACTVASSTSQPTARPAGSTRNSWGSTVPRRANPAAVRDFGSNGFRLAGSSGTPSRIAPATAAPLTGAAVDVVAQSA